MNKPTSNRTATTGMNRRRFNTTMMAGGALTAERLASAPRAFAQGGARPNFLLICTDQQHVDTIGALGAPGVKTPNMDRLARRGVAFTESYCTNPVCSPARSSLFTGRMPSETNVWQNGRPIQGMPNLGEVLGAAGYECYFAGKWHLPHSYGPDVPGFKVITSGYNGQGHLYDMAVSRSAEAFIRQRKGATPFFLYAGFLQPHDICQFGTMRLGLTEDRQYKAIQDELPPLPPNHDVKLREPEVVAKRSRRQNGLGEWTEQMWRYYIWAYDRMVEQVDAEIGRMLEALEDTGLDKNTVIIFTADHGEGRGRHRMITKNFLYEEAARVPMVISWPGHVAENVCDSDRLVSGLDVLATVCDFAGVKPPKHRGISMRPFVERKDAPGHEFVVSECVVQGRMLRTPEMKYIEYHGDPVRQLFNIQKDPWEMKNLAEDSSNSEAVADHAKLLRDWEATLNPTREARLAWT